MNEMLRNSDPSQIPAEWQFPDRNQPGLKVLQLDHKRRFLATNLPGNSGIGFHPEYKGPFGAYIFTPEGTIAAKLTHQSQCTSFVRRTAEMYSHVYVSNLFPSLDPTILYLYINTFPLELVEQGRTSWYEAFVGFDGQYQHLKNTGLAVTQTIKITNRFMVPGREDKGLIPSPGFALDVKRGQIGLSTQDWTVKYLEELELHNEIYADRYGYDHGEGLYYGFAVRQDQDRPNSVFFQDRSGKDIFHTTWDVVDGQNGREIYLDEEHLTTGTKRIARAPVTLDITGIKDSYLIKPPYTLGDDLALDVPWEGVDRFIGASLGYIYPPSKKK